MQLTKRAEAAQPKTLMETFVDVGPLITLLTSRDHQIIYGRRGTGKTHALVYLDNEVGKSGDLPIYIDLRSIGSSGGLYADDRVPLPERGTRLLLDVLATFHSRLVEYCLDRSYSDESIDISPVFPLLDLLANEIVRVRVEGDVERTEHAESSQSATSQSSISVSPKGPELKLQGGDDRTSTRIHAETRRGREHTYVHFGGVGECLRRIASSLDRHLWVLVDEWSTIPLELQPILADLLRRSLFPVPGLTVKIAAIEHRSRFREVRSAGDYLGIEVGADASANIDLDDFMVFGNDAAKATEFFRQLIFRHVDALMEDAGVAESDRLRSPDDLVRLGFTQSSSFDELVRAAEGVPRDAINVAALAAQLAGDARLSMDNVRDAARRWYQRDKESAVAAHTQAERLLNWIIDRVIGEKRTKGFLLDPAGINDENVRILYDARVLHLLRRGISSRDKPGVRFNAYALDFGCYVHLTASKAPLTLFKVEQERGVEGVQVPGDDYRSIRTAVLDLDHFYRPPA